MRWYRQQPAVCPLSVQLYPLFPERRLGMCCRQIRESHQLPFANLSSVYIYPAHAVLCSKSIEILHAAISAIDRPRKPYCLASTTMLRPSGVSSASDASCAASASSCAATPASRDKCSSLTVTKGNGPGFIKQQHVNITRCLNRPFRSWPDIFLHQPINAGQSLLGTQQAAMW